MSVASTQATRPEHRNMGTRACVYSLFDRLANISPPRSFSTALTLSDRHTRSTQTPLSTATTITHPAVFAHSFSHQRSFAGSLALSCNEGGTRVGRRAVREGYAHTNVSRSIGPRSTFVRTIRQYFNQYFHNAVGTYSEVRRAPRVECFFALWNVARIFTTRLQTTS